MCVYGVPRAGWTVCVCVACRVTACLTCFSVADKKSNWVESGINIGGNLLWELEQGERMASTSRSGAEGLPCFFHYAFVSLLCIVVVLATKIMSSLRSYCLAGFSELCERLPVLCWGGGGLRPGWGRDGGSADGGMLLRLVTAL